MSKVKNPLKARTIIFYLSVIFGSILLDRISKQLVIQYMPMTDGASAPIDLIHGVLRFIHIENQGAAFGSFADKRWVFMVFSVVAIILIVFYVIKENPQSMWTKSALALIVGGGAGNMIDRIARGSVTDFIDVYCVPFYVFNVADICVTVGCAVLVIYLLFIEIPRENREKKQKASEDAAKDKNASEKAEIDDE